MSMVELVLYRYIIRCEVDPLFYLRLSPRSAFIGKAMTGALVSPVLKLKVCASVFEILMTNG